MKNNNTLIMFFCISFLAMQKDVQGQLSKKEIQIIDTSVKSGYIYIEKNSLDEYEYYFYEKKDSLTKEFGNFKQWEKFKSKNCKQIFFVSDYIITNNNQTSTDSLKRIPLFCYDRSTQVGTIKTVSKNSFFEVNAVFVKSWFYKAKLIQNKKRAHSFLVWACTFQPGDVHKLSITTFPEQSRRTETIDPWNKTI